VVAQRKSRVVMNAVTIEERIQEAIANAEKASTDFGKDSKEAAVAWDFVEELEAERSHQKANGPVDPLDKFCEESPEADECRTYEN